MELNEYGKITKDYWENISNYFNNIKIDEYIVMPNHMHGIIHITKNDIVGNAYTRSLQPLFYGNNIKYKSHRINMKIPKIIQWYKSMVSKTINKNPEIYFQWQKSFQDRIIRNDYELTNIRNYIKNNPKKWERDRNNENGLYM